MRLSEKDIDRIAEAVAWKLNPDYRRNGMPAPAPTPVDQKDPYGMGTQQYLMCTSIPITRPGTLFNRSAG